MYELTGLENWSICLTSSCQSWSKSSGVLRVESQKQLPHSKIFCVACASLLSHWLPSLSLQVLAACPAFGPSVLSSPAVGFPPASWFHAWFQPRLIFLSYRCLWLSHLYLVPNFHFVLILPTPCSVSPVPTLPLTRWHLLKLPFTPYPVSTSSSPA